MFRSAVAILFAASLLSVKAFQSDEIEALSQLQSILPQSWKNVDFALQVKEALIQTMSKKAIAVQQLRDESSAPLSEIQEAEKVFITAMQNGAPQTEVDTKFKALTDIQQKYDVQLREASRLIQLNSVESEIAEDILLRNYALESCLLRRDILAIKSKHGELVTFKDLENEKKSLALTPEEIQAEKLLENSTGEAIVNQMENYCGKRAGILFESVKTIVSEHFRQQEALRQQNQPINQGNVQQ